MSPWKYQQVADRVRAQIADGMLLPGEPVPSGAALARAAGCSALTCRKAIRLLIGQGVLVAGATPNARPRVPSPGASLDELARERAGRALAAALASRRKAAGLTQPQLGEAIGLSVTTIGHAETARLWQSRDFWEKADKFLDAGGELLSLHDAYRSAGIRPGGAGSGSVTGHAGTADGEPSGYGGSAALAGLLTDDEHLAVRWAGLLYTFIAERVVGSGAARDDDLAEVRFAVHLLQRMVGAQAAARAYPGEFPLLSTVIPLRIDGGSWDEVPLTPGVPYPAEILARLNGPGDE